MAKKNQIIIDLSKMKLTGTQRKVLQDALHTTVVKQVKTLTEEDTDEEDSTEKTATLTVKFVSATQNEVTATHNLKNAQTITKSGTISFDNVISGDSIEVNGTSLGITTISIDVDAKPTSKTFPIGKININFSIN
jgi:hypothetical protein